MSAVVDIDAARAPDPLPMPAPPPPVNELVQDLERAVRVARTGDIEGALGTRTVAALSRLADEHPPAHARLRKALMQADAAVTGPMVDGMVKRHARDDEAPADESEFRTGAVEAIVERVQALGELFTAPDGAAYVRVHESPRAVLALGSRAFRETVAFTCYRDTGRAPKAAQLADALATLGGIAQHEGETHPVHLRVAVDPTGGYLVDLCDDEWRAVRITAAGWQVLNESPVRFRRTPGMKAMPEPARDGTRHDLMVLFNIDPADELLLLAALVETLRPDTPDPIMEFCGEQGSGKSRTLGNARAIVDPHEAPLRAPPRSLQDWYVGAGNNHMLCIDNVSSLSAEVQDGLCVMVTGGNAVQRTLYSDADETAINVKLPVGLTSIQTPFTRPDAISRVARFECPPLGKGRRLSDAELSAELIARTPKALGYLLDTMSRALALLPSIKLDEAPRLMDFAKLGEAIGQAEGHDAGCFTDRYMASVAATATQSLEAEPAITTLRGYLDDQNGHVEPVEIEPLRVALAAYASRHGTPQPPSTARALGSLLIRYGAALALTGVRVAGEPRSSNGRRVSVKRDVSLSGSYETARTTCTMCTTCIMCTTCTESGESARRVRSARSAAGSLHVGERDTHPAPPASPPDEPDAGADELVL